jgi:hypothetical protein
MRLEYKGLILGGLLGIMACTPAAVERNPFLGYTEEFGIAAQQQTSQSSAAGGAAAQAPFRRNATLQFRNNHTSADLNVSLAIWVNVSSIRSAEQQDALLAAGFTQLRREMQLGTAFTLPVGTFWYDPNGSGGATPILLGPASVSTTQQSTPANPTQQTITVPTPDAVLAFIQPPVSCESVAFFYSLNGQPLTSEFIGGGIGPFSGSISTGPFKTMAQVDVYECNPLRPGVFFRQTGARQPNEFLEGNSITFDFNPTPDANGFFGKVTISATP